jgi:hypothetical protein
MPTVVVNRLEIEPAPPPSPSEEQGAPQEQKQEKHEPSRSDVEKALRALKARAARITAD